MIKALVALSSISIGGTAVGAVVYMQTHPLAFTGTPETPAPVVDEDPPIRAPALPIRLAVRHEGTQVRELAAVPTVVIRPVGVTVAASMPATRPCSEWWSLGPKAVALGTEPSHNVRALCR